MVTYFREAKARFKKIHEDGSHPAKQNLILLDKAEALEGRITEIEPKLRKAEIAIDDIYSRMAQVETDIIEPSTKTEKPEKPEKPKKKRVK